MTLPSGQSPVLSDGSDNPDFQENVTTTYFFDAVLRADHNQEVVITNHPVQNGAAISDHAYSLPAKLILEVGFSDAMDSYRSRQYSGGSSKSVNAYKAFKQIKDLHLACTLTTRMDQYENMVIAQIVTPETRETSHSAKMAIRFQQILVGQVSKNIQSARPDQTDTTPCGTITPTPVPGTQTQNFFEPSVENQPQWSSESK